MAAGEGAGPRSSRGLAVERERDRGLRGRAGGGGQKVAARGMRWEGRDGQTDGRHGRVHSLYF